MCDYNYNKNIQIEKLFINSVLGQKYVKRLSILRVTLLFYSEYNRRKHCNRNCFLLLVFVGLTCFSNRIPQKSCLYKMSVFLSMYPLSKSV